MRRSNITLSILLSSTLRVSSFSHYRGKYRPSFSTETSHPRPRTTLSLIMNSDSDTNNSKPNAQTIEVEQKFVVSSSDGGNDDLKERLVKLGFQSAANTGDAHEDTTTVTFMDWYFDVLPADSLVLCTQDCWLRYRHMSNDVRKGSWQLKEGNGNGSTRSTVYQEIEGDEALRKVQSILEESSVVQDGLKVPMVKIEEMDGFKVPRISKSSDDKLSLLDILEPYARIETTRSSWTRSIIQEGTGVNQSEGSMYDTITVDIDATDFGHMVGEVECIVANEDEISDAKARIQDVINDLMMGREPNRDTLTLGKLETYLIQKQPEIYDACVNSGTMKDRN